MIFQIFQFFLVFIAPSLLGALAYSVASRLRSEISWTTTLILALVTFTTMITGLYFLKDVTTVDAILREFSCLSFTRRYILLSTGISVFYGAIFGLIRRLFSWIR